MKLQNVGIFFDRDGTLNTEVDFLTRPEELALLPGAAKSLREANEHGIKVFVITNQSGIARGFFTESDLHVVHARLEELLALEGAHVDRIYYCPHHPTFGIMPYRVECACRKPNSGMIERAAREFKINLANSFVVGDRCIDVQAGERAGCGTILVRTGYGATEVDECKKTARIDYIAENVYGAWRYIKKQLDHRN